MTETLRYSPRSLPTPGLVSVVIPSYNYGHFLPNAVESALQQTYKSIEVIVVDDGSDDDTFRRLSAFAKRIRYVYQRNCGLSAARNTGIRLANGEWIAFLDADDVWHPQKTEIQLRAASGFANVGLIGSLPAKHLPAWLDPAPPTRSLSVRDFCLSGRTGPSGTLIRRRCFEVVGLFDEQLRSVEDRDMWLRVATTFGCIQVFSACWWYRPHLGQMSRNADRMLKNYQTVLNRFFRQHPEHSSLRRLAWSYLYLDGAWAFLHEGNRRTARRLLLKSIALWPLSIGDSGVKSMPRVRTAARLLLGDFIFRQIKRLPAKLPALKA